MGFYAKLKAHGRTGSVGAALAVVLGLALWSNDPDNGFARLSYDLLHLCAPKVHVDDVILIAMDQLAHTQLHQIWKGQWDRSLHTQLLHQLSRDRCRMVVFDVWLADAVDAKVDNPLASAIRALGRVVLAGEQVRIPTPAFEASLPTYTGTYSLPPYEKFRDAVGTNWGIPQVDLPSDLAIRRHCEGTDLAPSLAWAAALR